MGVVSFAGVLFPVLCALCGRPGDSPCRVCRLILQRARLTEPGAIAGVERFAALLSYDGDARRLVSSVKYRNRRASLDWIACELAALTPGVPDVVSWVPTTSARRRERGFDQSRLLARRVAAGLERPCRGTLRRSPGPPQTGRSAVERRSGPVFAARVGLPGSIVLLVDDVVTTGATVRSAAAVLRADAGVAEVWAVAVARTLLKDLRG